MGFNGTHCSIRTDIVILRTQGVPHSPCLAANDAFSARDRANLARMPFARAALVVAGVSFVIAGCAGSSTAHAPVETGGPHTDGEVPASVGAREPVGLSTDGITFERGSSELQVASGATLDALASAIAGDGDGSLAVVRVSLQPDPEGCSPEPLARRRADAIRAALVERGVPAARVRSEGVSGRSPSCAPVLASRSTVTVELVPR